MKGRVEAISYKRNGVKINGKWYDAEEQVIQSIQQGQEYIFTLEDNTITAAEPYDRDAYWEERNKQIRRLALINAAIEFHKIEAAQDGTAPTEEDILRTAKKFEEWVVE